MTDNCRGRSRSSEDLRGWHRGGRVHGPCGRGGGQCIKDGRMRRLFGHALGRASAGNRVRLVCPAGRSRRGEGIKGRVCPAGRCV